jgi:plasmid stabilization system protein ParE
VLYYRAVGPSAVEVVRVLHERMAPSRHLREVPEDSK